MTETLANIAVIAATIGTVTFLVPQTVKLIRTRDTEGVSATWPAMGFVVNLGWFVYMIAQELWVATLAPFVTFLSYLVVLWALRRAGRELTAGAWRAGAWGGMLGLVGVIGGWEPLGVALGVSIGVQLSPSVWSAYRSPDPSGVSPMTWWIGLAEALLWGYYGLFNRDAGIVTFGVVASVAALLMLARYYLTRGRVAAVQPPSHPLTSRQAPDSLGGLDDPSQSPPEPARSPHG